METAAEPLRDHLTEWLDRVGTEHLAGAEPQIPDAVTDRAAEVWEPLLSLADLAGGHWPDTARAAAVHFVTSAASSGSSIGTRLLADLRALFLAAGTDRMETADILTQLLDSEDGAWGDLDGRPLDARRLARELGRYNIRPKDLKLPGGSVRKGYRTDGPDGLADVWLRYLPPAATNATAQVRPVAAQPPVADTNATARTDQSPHPPQPPPCRAAPHHPPEPAAGDQVADTAATTPPSATHLTRAVAAVADNHGEPPMTAAGVGQGTRRPRPPCSPTSPPTTRGARQGVITTPTSVEPPPREAGKSATRRNRTRSHRRRAR